MRQANEMSHNITNIEKALTEKEGFMALAHTRLGNRCQRPGLELTTDRVETSLTREVVELREIVSQLQQKLCEVSENNIYVKYPLIIKDKTYINFSLAVKSTVNFRIF